MQYIIVYAVVYDIVCFCPSSLEALKMACVCLSWWLCISHCILLIHTKVTLFNQCIVPLHMTFVHAQHCHPPTQWPSIYIISRAVLRTDHLLYTLTGQSGCTRGGLCGQWQSGCTRGGLHPHSASARSRHHLRAAMANFSGSELQKSRISYLWSPNVRPRGWAYCSKGFGPYAHSIWEGVPGWLGQQPEGVAVKKDVRYRRSDIRYRMSTYYVNV